MFEAWKKLKYGARVLLSAKGGEAETIDVRGRFTVIMHGGDGPAFVYLHSTLGESFRWFPFYQTWSKQFSVYVPTHPGFGKSGGFDQIDTIEDMAFHYVELFDALGLGEIILGGVSLGGWIAAEFACRWPERVKKLWLSAAPGLWVDEEPLPDLFREMTDRKKVRSRLFHDPDGYMAKLVIADDANEEQMLSAYQSLTVLAPLGVGAALRPETGGAAASHSVPDIAVVGSARSTRAAGLWRGIPEAFAAGGNETDPGMRPHGDVRERSGVCGGGNGVLSLSRSGMYL